MADIDAKLLTGEEVVFQTKKHWFAPLSDSVRPILLILGSFVVAWLQTDATTGIVGFGNRVLELIELGLFLVGVGWIIYNIVAWTTAQYAVTNRRVFGKEGLVHSRSTDTLLTSVADVRTAIPFFGKMLGFGKISIMSASGESGSDTFTSVRKVEEFKQQILEQKTTNPGPAGGGVAAQAAPAAAAPGSDAMATLAGLAKLRDDGAISPAEYEAKKQEVLSRI